MHHTGEHHSSYNEDLDIVLRLRERARERAEIRHRLLDEATTTANRMNIIFLGGGEPSDPRVHALERRLLRIAERFILLDEAQNEDEKLSRQILEHGENRNSHNDDLDTLLYLREREAQCAEIKHRMLDEAAHVANMMNTIFMEGGEPSDPRIQAIGEAATSHRGEI
ncbi:hypothetical protein N7471_007768 [Penicillium samsonianum]|uniref:uncharacterized protein n=1 Tax=Penicillium samsonianum TaxID=1882272 RepID=UPI0025490EB5|nr:uncharacterized protein N7471_007768 [Penicillium samsonianum]KAJ6132553.1 hypothetical protein N7471_007768 [Penicillium samsonianum]